MDSFYGIAYVYLESTIIFIVKHLIVGRLFPAGPIYALVCQSELAFASIFVCGSKLSSHFLAGVAQLVEQLICNHQVVGSSPITGSI